MTLPPINILFVSISVIDTVASPDSILSLLP